MYNEDLAKKQRIMLNFLRDIEPKIIKLAKSFFSDFLKKDVHEVSAYTISDLVLELEDVAPYDEEMVKLNPANYDYQPIKDYLVTVKDLYDIRAQRRHIDKLGFGDHFSEILHYLFTIKDPSTSDINRK